MAKYDFDDEDGVWRTVGGRRIFIREGESLSSAMKSSGKFKSAKRNIKGPNSKEIKEINKKVDEEFGTEEKAKQYEQDKGLRDLIKDKDALNERLLEMKKSGEYKELLGDNDEKSIKEAEDRIKQEREKWQKEKELSNKSDKPYSEKQLLEDLSKSQRDTTGVDFDWKASDEKLERLGKEVDTLEDKISKMPKNERMKSEENRQSMSKLGESLDERSEREVQNLKNYVRDNYDNPEDFLRDYDAQVEASKKGTRAEKFKDAKGYMDINEAIEARGRNDVQRIVNELKKENEYNDKIIADYEKAKASGQADKVAEKLGLKQSNNNSAYKKAFQEYMKQHPNSKLTLQKFIDMSEGK